MQKMIKVSDYIAKRLVEHGVKQVFMVTGGGAMHLNDSIGRHKDIEYICNHHEQACAIAAEGYARVSGKLVVVNVTTGPGGLNTLTGVMGQWTDSVPVLYLSGQVKFETTIASLPEPGLRQLGDQEINIVDVVRPVTKYAAMITEPDKIRKTLDKAVYLATHGRPGPVWIDVPMNIQGAMIEENEIPSYNENEDEITFDPNVLKSQVSDVINLIMKSERPVFIAGHGIRISGAQELFLDIVRKMNMPVLSTFNGFDLIETDDPLSVGRIGTQGDRAGNFALQNADVVLSVGSRNNIRQVSYDWKQFARDAKKIVVDIDECELKKPTLAPDIAVRANARDFLEEMDRRLAGMRLLDYSRWLEWCLQRKSRYPVVLEEYKNIEEAVHPYYFVHTLTEETTADEVTVAGNGTASVALFQAARVKRGQRFIHNSGCAAMGYDLPAAIGACLGRGRRNTVCIAGDGSMQMNIQELATVAYHKLPIKLFYLNNGGYISIRQTQKNFFGGYYVGSGPESGLGFPDVSRLAAAYGIQYERIENHSGLGRKIRAILDLKGPVLCEVILTEDYVFAPKVSSERKADGKIVSKPLEDMYPFLDRREFKENMLVPQLPKE